MRLPVIFTSLLTMAAIVAAGGQAQAAGATAPNWAGTYVGGQVGGGWGTESDDLDSVLKVPADSFSISGAIGGVYAGYDWQVDNNLLLGVEAEVNASDLTGSWSFTTPIPGTLTFSTNWQAAVKGRVGVPVDQALIYGTAGVVWAGGNEHLVLPGPSVDVSASATHTGWLVGAGVEYALTDHLATRAEIDYTGFSSQPYSGFGGGGSGTVDVSWGQTTATVGLSYRF